MLQKPLPFAIETKIAQRTGFVSTPGEHWQRHRNRNVDADLSDIYIFLELASSCARLSEYGSTVPVLVFIDDLNGFIESISAKNKQDGTEYLLSNS
jgi:hypothetical protein